MDLDVINILVGVPFGCSCDSGSILFLLASFERPTCIATEISTPSTFPCRLLQIPDLSGLVASLPWVHCVLVLLSVFWGYFTKGRDAGTVSG